MVSRLCVQKWRVIELQRCSANHPGKIYSGPSLRYARGFLVIICHYRNVLRVFAPPLNQIEGRIKRDLEASPVIHVCLCGFLYSWGWMRDTGRRINFGVGLLGASNLAEENMLPICVISAASMSEEMRAGFYQWRWSEDQGKESKRKTVIRTEQASHYLFLVCARARLQGMKSDRSPSPGYRNSLLFYFFKQQLCSLQSVFMAVLYSSIFLYQNMLLSGFLQIGKAGSHIYTALSLHKSFISERPLKQANLQM